MKLVSYSLFGNQKIYKTGLLHNIEIAKKLLPDWKIRIYFCSKVDKKFIDLCKNSNTEIIIKDRNYKYDPMLWRMLPMEENHDAVIVRDVDTRIWDRDKRLIDDWLKSDFKFHVARENLGSDWPIMAGIWGGKKPNLKIKKNFNKWIKKEARTKNSYINDQAFLSKFIYPIIRHDLLVYSDHVVMDCENNVKSIPGGQDFYKGKRIMIGMPVIDDFFEEDKNLIDDEYFQSQKISKYDERINHWHSEEENIVPDKPKKMTQIYKYTNPFLNIFVLIFDITFKKKLNIFKILFIFFWNKVLRKFINLKFKNHNLSKYYK